MGPVSTSDLIFFALLFGFFFFLSRSKQQS